MQRECALAEALSWIVGQALGKVQEVSYRIRNGRWIRSQAEVVQHSDGVGNRCRSAPDGCDCPIGRSLGSTNALPDSLGRTDSDSASLGNVSPGNTSLRRT
jgi:hypothetical protein